MNAHFGIWNFDRKEIDHRLLARVCASLEAYAGLETEVIQEKSLAILFDASGTNARPVAVQPNENRPWIFWDGRLDNRQELQGLGGGVPDSAPDTDVLRGLYERRGATVFAQIVGDWAVSFVCRATQELVLAKDFVGTRPLFYRVQNSSVMWSTILGPLVLAADRLPALSEEYLAGWLSCFPESHRTPYRDIFCVPPASFVRITPHSVTVNRYWNIESAKLVRYRTDKQYEEHFVSTFREAVRRRIRCAGPILAELSGGMDSSSIVCMADSIVSDSATSPRIDTVTYFDPAESTWDELPYARKVEEQRGRPGYHIDIGPEQGVTKDSIPSRFRAVPVSTYDRSSSADVFDRIVSDGGYRVLLSGLGGDEVLGGVPTPVPELADLLVRLRGYRFLRQSFRWALAKKKPLIGLWRSSFLSFVPGSVRVTSVTKQAWSWLTPDFYKRNRAYLGFHPESFRVFGPLPSLQANALALEVLSRQLSCAVASTPPAHEWRYPFLDQDLVMFCCSIPREQILRPRQRRSLMRRALAGLVPREILERKRKAYVSRALVKILAAEWLRLNQSALFRIEEMGIAVAGSLAVSVKQTLQGKDDPTFPILRLMVLEQWLRDLNDSFVRIGARSRRESIGGPVYGATQQLLGREKSQ
jgi:asparagine synthase (glutamine-hydrolysing)